MTTTHELLPVVQAACCEPISTAPLDAAQAESLAKILKSLADPSRLRLLSIVAASPSGEVCACDLNEPVGLSQPTVSHHLKVLVDAGILAREKRGVWAWYSVVPGTLAALATVLTGPAAR